MNRRKAIKLILLGSASITSLISFKWLDRLRATDVAYLENKKSLVAELAETIIPHTDTPGAKAVKVEAFIIRMLKDCTDAKSLSNFIIGLQELEEYSLGHYQGSFMACSPDQRTAIMQEFERRSVAHWGLLAKIENKLIGKPFFTLLKNYTISGYCTSMGGATQALNYLGVPGSYENIGPIGPDCRAWATK
ncbi:MAG: gluconate 2-dehydrogenase subunit 3 family protein [Adhaeribacter sp.]